MNKICNKCRQEKSFDEFNSNKRHADGKQKTCRECTKKQHLDWYYKNQTVQIAKNKVVAKNKKDAFIEFKKTCECKKCGDKRWYILDFHHLEPTKKDFVISSNYLLGKDKFWSEIEKCITLCRNCHSEFHHLEREHKITIKDYLK